MPTTIYDDDPNKLLLGESDLNAGSHGIKLPSFPGPSGAVVGEPASGGSDGYVQRLNDLARSKGVTTENYADVFAHHANGNNLDAIFNDLSGSIDRRAASNQSSGGASGGPQITSLGQFTDPIGGSVENAAANRANALTNPPNGSGQNLLEQLLKKVSAQFEGGGFTPAEQETFQTQALDPLERLRTARKQQVMEELSRRGINPSSGIAQQMLQNVDAQFDSHRATTQRDIAAKGANETTQRMMQAVQLLTQLAGTQDTRLDKAFNYQTVPLNLADRSFSQAMQLYSQNNPLSMVQPLLALSQQQQGQQSNQGAALADLIWTLTHQG